MINSSTSSLLPVLTVFLDDLFLPSVLFAPTDFSHGFQF
jgi:hypothetical protein